MPARLAALSGSMTLFDTEILTRWLVRSRIPPWGWVILLWIVLIVPAISLRGAHYEEGTTIALARGAFEDGHWLAPHRYGMRFVERPVLVSWLLGVVGSVTGFVNLTMARIPIVLSLLGSALLLFWFVRRYASIHAALFAAVCFLASPMMLQKLVTAEVDSVVSFLVFLALVTWWTGREGGGPTTARWAAIAGILTAAALVKGPQQLAFFFIGAGGYLAIRRDWREFARLVLCGLAPLTATLAWYAAVYQPGDAQLWAAHSRLGQSFPPGAYLAGVGRFAVQFALECLPGILLAIPLAIDLYRRRFNTQRELAIVLLLYAFACTAILVFWPGARTRYAMPAVLAVAALAGLAFDHYRLIQPRLAAAAIGIAGVLGAYALTVNWIAMPLAPGLFQPFTEPGRFMAQSMAARPPAPLMITSEALQLNALVYVPGEVRHVSLGSIRAARAPFWAAVTPEQERALRAAHPQATVTRYAEFRWPQAVSSCGSGRDGSSSHTKIPSSYVNMTPVSGKLPDQPFAIGALMWFARPRFVLPLLAMVMSGCSADSYMGSRAIVVHGKFAHLNCTQIEGSIKSTQSRIDEINGLIRKASQEAGGSAIATVVYGAPLADAEATLRIYREAQIEKKCLDGASVSRPPY